MKRTRIIVFMVILNCLSSLTAFAQHTQESCSRIDITDHYPGLKGLFNHPRDQGNVGLCYAYPAADILSILVGRPVSAIAVALNDMSYYRDNFWYRNFLDANTAYPKGGLAGEAFAASQALGFCLESELQSNVGESTGLLDAFEAIHEAIFVAKYGGEFNPDPMILKSYFNTFSKSSKEHLLGVAKNNRDKSFIEVLLALKNSQCTQRVRVSKNFGWQNLDVKEMSSVVISKIDKILESKLPLETSFETTFLKGFTRDSLHSMLLIGREWKGDQCRYRFRNSWGTGCQFYSPTLQPYCDGEKGQLLISETEILENAISIGFAQ